MSVEPKIMEHVKQLLQSFGDRYITNSGHLKRAKIIDDLDRFDHNLMTKLFADPLIHRTYVEKIANTEVFKLNQFIEMFEYKDYWEDSFTKYENKIGLTTGGKFLDESADVVLDFPFKDTVLKAGMTKEDVANHHDADEPFLNETIAKPEIDELLEPKIFVNSQKYDSTGAHSIDAFSSEDNLVLKGNNLIALYSLKQRYAGKVKFIYIDPPYNTGKDSFKYNDEFSRSTWLTFMLNRLVIARKLLSDDGSIYISIDENEFSYLKILVNNIFGELNELETFHIQVRYTNKSLNERDDFQRVMEYGLFYAKDKSKFKANKPSAPYNLSKFEWQITELSKGHETILGGKKVTIFHKGEYKIERIASSVLALKATWASGSVLAGNTSGKFFDAQLSKRKKIDGLNVLYKVENIGDDGLGYRYFTGPKKENSIRGQFYSGVPTKRVTEISNGTSKKYKPVVNFYDFSGDFGNIRQEGGVSLNGGKKPEKMIKLFMSIATVPGDLILDYHLGSGTTAAVAMKYKRKFIGIEQMSNQITLTQTRLNNVIHGDETGISKDVDWHGGGSFVYAELFEKNQGYLKDLLAAENDAQLEAVYARMQAGADFDFRVDLAKYDELKKGLSFTDRQKLLVKMLDKNQLYYNYANIDDADVRDLISDNDYAFNKSFYGEGGLADGQKEGPQAD